MAKRGWPGPRGLKERPGPLFQGLGPAPGPGPKGAPGPDPGSGPGRSFGPHGLGRPVLAMSHEPRDEYNDKN